VPITTNSILLVDDSTDDEYLLKRTLRLSGVANPVILVGDGEEAIAYLKGEAPYADREKHPLPRVVMLDLKLPEMSGFDVLKWIKDQPSLKELLVVVISQHDEVEQIRRAYELGASSFLSKPCRKEDLQDLAQTLSPVESSEGIPPHPTIH
jgi:CheY-like chemotaxis protein